MLNVRTFHNKLTFSNLLRHFKSLAINLSELIELFELTVNFNQFEFNSIIILFEWIANFDQFEFNSVIILFELLHRIELLSELFQLAANCDQLESNSDQGGEVTLSSEDHTD